MKFILFEICVLFFIFKYEFADATNEEHTPLRCEDACEKGIDLSKIESAIKRAKCGGKVNLDGFRSATKLVRSLVCKCDSNGHYIPRGNRCLQMCNCDIIIRLVQVDLPLIVDGICGHVGKNSCEAIQIVVDGLANVYQSCIGGGLSFQGDKTNGKQVEYFVETCLDSAMDDLTDSLKLFNEKNPGASEAILDVVTKHTTPALNVYYGPIFRKCVREVAGRQTIELCGCDKGCGKA